MKKVVVFIAFFVCLFQFMSFGQHSPAPFKAGDRVVFAGNSITEAGLYGSYIWLYYMTHFPNRQLRIINGGVGGDVAENIYRRLEGDLFPKKPTTLVLTFGMNDSKYFEYNDKQNPVTEQRRQAIVQESYKSYLKIQDSLLQHPEIKKILMSSSPYDETVQQQGDVFKGKAKTMELITAFQKEAAKENNWAYVDLFHPMTSINEREQLKNPAYTSTGPDRIHPGSAGHLIMAYIFLKNQGLAGNPVADFSIQAGNNKVNRTANCQITQVASKNGVLTFDYLAGSLPFPIDSLPRVWGNKQVESEALSVIPFMEEFNMERMRIQGLKADKYKLVIDNQLIGVFGKDQLSIGINLATLHNTPQYHQALAIMDLNNKRKEIEAKFRNYYWIQYDYLYEKGLLFDTTDASIDTLKAAFDKNGWVKGKFPDYEAVRNNGKALSAEMDNYIDKIYASNKPIKRHFEIIPID